MPLASADPRRGCVIHDGSGLEHILVGDCRFTTNATGIGVRVPDTER